MNNVHILSKHDNEEVPEKMVKRLPNCPVCGAKAFLRGDAPSGFWFGWSVGCPRYCLNDGIHGHNDNTPSEEHLVAHGFDTKEAVAEWWCKRVSKYTEYEKDGESDG